MTRTEKITGVEMIVAVACGIALLAVFAPVSLSPSGVSIDNADAFTCPTGVYVGTDAAGNYECQGNLGGDLGGSQIELYSPTTNQNIGTGQTNVAGGQVATPGNPVTDQCSSGITLSPATWFSSTCWESTIANTIGTLLIWISSWFLTLAGEIFDYAFDNTVLQFGTLVNDNIISAINATWSVFRDISNILIIGMFTFIAIMTILGSVDYGAKRLLSRVLIVAVLINFSLLFAKIVIDVSNFTATQFYQNATVTTQTTSTSVSSSGQTTFSPGGSGTYGGTNANSDVALAFIGYAGASSWGNTSTMLTNVQSNSGAMMVLVYGVVISLMEIAAAIVLLYGTFLLAARAITLIFLMITSSIAFASYLIPSNIGEGFGTWWRLLLKNAVFAPLLVILLWVTLTVAQAFAKTPQSGTLTTALVNPTSVASYAPLFEYVIIIALLFISLKVSSSVASHVGGLNLGQNWAARFGSGSGSVSAKLAGLFNQQTFSRFAHGRQESLNSRAKEDNLNAARANASARTHERAGNIALANFAKSEANRLQKRAVNNAQWANRYGAVATKNVGGVESFGAAIERRAKAAAKTAEKIGLTKAQQDELRKNAEKDSAAAQQSTGDFKQKQTNADDAQKNAAALKQMVDSQKQLVEEERKKADAEIGDATKIQSDKDKEHDAVIKELDRRIKETSESKMGDTSKLEIERQERLAQKKSDFDQQAERIKQAHTKVAGVQKQFSDIQLQSKQADADADAAMKILNDAKQKIGEAAKVDAGAALDKNKAGLVRQVIKKQSTITEKIVGNTKDVEEETLKKLRKHKSATSRMREAFKDMEGHDDHEGHNDHH